MNFTKEQLQAIETRGCNILVSAAAGSGKTAVLVERIIHKVVKDKVNIDELLVVTFTNAAAIEMKERIIFRIEKELQNDTKNFFLQEQLIRINKAQISTIDAFCLKVVKENFKEIDIEPNFRIGDANEIEILINDTLEDFLESYYEKEDEQFFNVLDAFSKKSDDIQFKNLFLDIYNLAQNSPYPEIWLKEAYARYEIQTEQDLFESKLFESIIEYSREVLDNVLAIKNYIDKLIIGANKAEKVINFLNNEFNQYKEAIFYLEERNFKGFFQCFKNIKFEIFRVTSLKENPILQDEIKELRNRAKGFIIDIQKEFFYKDIEEILDDNRKIYPIIKKLCNMIIEFDHYFFGIKKIKSVFTFNDISHFCLNILIDKEEYKTTNIALDYKNKFNEIITDEFQDSNLIQEEILSAISKENNRFMVGDIKQCIYRFRQADTKIFNEKYLGYFENENLGKRIDLNANFRSCSNVLDCINFIFEKIMSSTLGEVEYDENAKLKKINEDNKKPDEINISTDCELHVINTFSDDIVNDEFSEELQELNNLEIEAHFIAKKIKTIIFKEKLHTFKNGQYLPIDYNDIVILSRDNSFASVLSKVFDEYDIPIFSKTNNGFFQITEVSIVLNILKIIDNPLQEIPLISVMCSPIFDFSLNELLEIKLRGNNKLFYNCIFNYINDEKIYKSDHIVNKLNLFLEKIKRWTELARTLSLNELLDRIYKESNYYNYVGLLKNGNLRQANLFNLLEKAIDFEKTSLNGIFSFINYIEKINKIQDRECESNILSENENVVRVMTIHKSKGLEFPIVFVSGLSKKFNVDDVKGAILFDYEHKLGVSINFKDQNKDEFFPRYTINSIQRSIIKKKIIRACYSEEIRVLYVALTRAKEKLILTGTINNENFFEKLEKMESTIISSNILNQKLILPNLFIDKSPTYLLWIYSILKSFKEKNVWKLYFENKEDIFLGYSIKNNIKKQETDFEKLFDLKNESIENEQYTFIDNSLNWVYPFEIDKNLEISLTVSEIKRKFQLDFYNEFLENRKKINTGIDFDKVTYNLPKFYENNKEKISSLARGTLYHTIFEHLDFNINSLEQLEVFINFLEQQGIITNIEKDILDKKKILMFLKSNLASRIKNSKFVKKEMPFKLGINASELYNNAKKSNSIMIINGIIDLFFEEDEKIILVDYKTDELAPVNLILKRYEIQLDIYKRAIEVATGKKVSEGILYLILEGAEIKKIF